MQMLTKLLNQYVICSENYLTDTVHNISVNVKGK